MRNKAGLVIKGYNQEEGINYKKKNLYTYGYTKIHKNAFSFCMSY